MGTANSVVRAWGRGVGGVGRGIRGINGHGEKYNKRK